MRLFVIDVAKIVEDRFLIDKITADLLKKNNSGKSRKEELLFKDTDSLKIDGMDIKEIIENFFKPTDKFKKSKLTTDQSVVIEYIEKNLESRVDGFVEMYIKALEMKDEIVLLYNKENKHFYDEINKRVNQKLITIEGEKIKKAIRENIKKTEGEKIRKSVELRRNDIEQQVRKNNEAKITTEVMDKQLFGYNFATLSDNSRLEIGTIYIKKNNQKFEYAIAVRGVDINDKKVKESVIKDTITEEQLGISIEGLEKNRHQLLNKIFKITSERGHTTKKEIQVSGNNIPMSSIKSDEYLPQIEQRIRALVDGELEHQIEKAIDQRVTENMPSGNYIPPDVDSCEITDITAKFVYQEFVDGKKDDGKKYAPENIILILPFYEKPEILKSFNDENYNFSFSLDFPNNPVEWLKNIEFPVKSKPQTKMYSFFAHKEASAQLEKAFETLFSFDQEEMNWINIFYIFVRLVGAALGAYPNAVFTNEDVKIVFNTENSKDWRIVWAKSSSFAVNFFINNRSIEKIPEVANRIQYIEKRLSKKVKSKNPNVKINPTITRLFAASILLVNGGTFFSNMQFANDTTSQISNPSLRYVIYLGQLGISIALVVRSTFGKAMPYLLPEQNAAGNLIRKFVVLKLAECLIPVNDEDEDEDKGKEKEEAEGDKKNKPRGGLRYTIQSADGSLQELTKEEINKLADGILIEGGSKVIKYSLAIPLLILLVPYSGAFGVAAYEAAQKFFSNMIGDHVITEILGGIAGGSALISKYLLVGDSTLTISEDASKVRGKKVVHDDRELSSITKIILVFGIIGLFDWNTGFGAAHINKEYLTDPLFKWLKLNPTKAESLIPPHITGSMALVINGVDSYATTYGMIKAGKQFIENKVLNKQQKITYNQKILYYMINYSQMPIPELLKKFVHVIYDSNNLHEKNLLIPGNSLIPNDAKRLQISLYEGFSFKGKDYDPKIVLNTQFWDLVIALAILTGARPKSRELAYKKYVDEKLFNKRTPLNSIKVIPSNPTSDPNVKRRDKKDETEETQRLLDGENRNYQTGN